MNQLFLERKTWEKEFKEINCLMELYILLTLKMCYSGYNEEEEYDKLKKILKRRRL